MSIQKKIFVGSVWAIAMRWAIRLLGMLSVIVLARLLHPADFGIMAMAMLLIGALSTFAELGVALMVIREADISRVDLDTAWTLRILQGLILAVLVALLAGAAADYFREPRVTVVVYLGALGLFISGFENIGVTLIRRELDFSTDFRYQIILKVLGVVIVIALALWLRSYWALALSQPVNALASVATSYVIHPYRPRFCLKRWRRFVSFSANIGISNLARFVTNKADVFIVGSIGTPGQMGVYNVAADLSSMPSRELTTSVGRALLPALAKLKHASQDFLAAFLQVMGSVAVLCIPIGVGLWSVADDVVHVILGANWQGTEQLMRILAVYGTLMSLIDVLIGHVLIVTGHERRQTFVLWVRSILLVLCALAGTRWSVEGIAIGAAASSVIMFVIAVWVLKVTLRCRLAAFVSIFWRPLVAAVLMGSIVHVSALAADPSLRRLLVSIAVGIASYVTTLLLLWLLAGRPAGIETDVISAITRRRKPLAGSTQRRA